jgi:hypothetical protein
MRHTNMNWKVLKDGKCPKCGNMLRDSGLGAGNIPAMRCVDKECDFKISEKRFKEIVAPKSRECRNAKDNLREWKVI